MEIETSFKNNYRDYYEGSTVQQFPYYIDDGIGGIRYLWVTSKTSGSLKTPHYGEQFDENKFVYVAQYKYGFHFPSNLADVTKSNPGLKFVLHFYMDVALYPGIETFQIQPYGSNRMCAVANCSMQYGYTRKDLKINSAYEEEWLPQTGNISVIRKYDTSRLTEGNFLWLELIRKLEKSLVDKILEKRNTGFELTWYYEDSDGNKVDIEETGFTEWYYEDRQAYFFEWFNERPKFVVFINLVYEALTYHNISLQSLWDIAKKFRLDYNYKKIYIDEDLLPCFVQSVLATDIYLQFFSSSLNISFTFQTQSVYKDQITDDLLFDGFQLFHYVARCRDMDVRSTNTFENYINIFNKDSIITILEAAMSFSKVDKRLKLARSIWKENYAGKLLDKMNELFGLNIYKLAVLASSVDDLEDIRDQQIRKETKNCLEKGSCEELMAIVSDQGKEFSGGAVNLLLLLCGITKNTSLVAPGALAHRLQHLTACLIQNGQWGLEIGQTLGYWTLRSTFAK